MRTRGGSLDDESAKKIAERFVHFCEANEADGLFAEDVLADMQWYDRDGQEISSRNLHRLEVRDGKITEWTLYCTGEWSSETRERKAREAPMSRQ